MALQGLKKKKKDREKSTKICQSNLNTRIYMECFLTFLLNFLFWKILAFFLFLLFVVFFVFFFFAQKLKYWPKRRFIGLFGQNFQK